MTPPTPRAHARLQPTGQPVKPEINQPLRHGDRLPDTPWATERVFVDRPVDNLSGADVLRLHREGKPVPMVSYVVGRVRG